MNRDDKLIITFTPGGVCARTNKMKRGKRTEGISESLNETTIIGIKAMR
jgi:hypothetical protein